ncbi:hypothetical protein FACS189434_13570 [Bacteroidia bacterium]|nr:hypothetical protein FACS189434_13570 [Bacteroidia bacterium]
MQIGAGEGQAENPHFATPSQYRSSTFYGYYRPINETESTANSFVTAPTTPERTYFGGMLQEVVVTAPAPIKIEPKIPLLKLNTYEN